jgi:type II secretory pathway component PulK
VSAPRREGGFILVVVMVFALLLASSLAAFLRRATVDSMIVRHRDESAEAEAAARGGVRLAITLLLEDRLQELSSDFRSESSQDVWALASEHEIPAGEGLTLKLRIEDAGARLNLNALIEKGKPTRYAELYLTAVLEYVIDQLSGDDATKRYEPAKLARNLLDYMDADEVAIDGGQEADAYARREPPTAVANRPLLSLDELRTVEGFDTTLVHALEPYVTVFPWVKGKGINPNTAPPHVLALLYHGTGGNFELAKKDEVKRVLKARDDGDILCADDAPTPVCRKISEAVPDTIFPEPTYSSDVFLVRAEARVGDVRRTIDTVVDRSKPSEPQLLAWKVR